MVITSISLGRSPFQVLQLLWINLIMDTLGAIAICTEPYEKAKFERQLTQETTVPVTYRVKRSDDTINANLWRSILCQFTYQLLSLGVLVYFGCFMFFDKPFNLITTPIFVKDEKGVSGPSNQMVLDTIVFHTFVLMCLFNQINCRVITPEDNINIF